MSIKLSRLKNSSKGKIHHVEIHPTMNGKGGRSFLTKTFRRPSKTAQDQADTLGRYLPESALDQEHTHDNAQDMAAHVGRTYGVQPPADDSETPNAEPDTDDE